MMAPIEEALEKLSKASAQLNEETEDLNRAISTLEERLNAAQPGVSVWLNLDLDDERGSNEHHAIAWTIGYAKLGAGEWRIAAKKVRWRESRSDYSGQMEWNIVADESPPVALLQAPRIVRVEAAPYLERLVKELAERVETFRTNIRKAVEASEE